MIRRRGLLNIGIGEEEHPPLPDEYQAVEYIQGQGSPWIDTGIPISTFYSDDASFLFRFSLTTTSRTMILMGARDRDGNSKQIVLVNGKIRKDWAGSQGAFFTTVPVVNDVYEIRQQNGVLYFEDESASITVKTGTWSRTCALFGQKNSDANVEASTKAYMRLYAFQAKGANGAMLADYVPCYSKSTPTQIGVYDFVTETLIVGKDGDFTKGADI